jgi:hypothetical protein
MPGQAASHGSLVSRCLVLRRIEWEQPFAATGTPHQKTRRTHQAQSNRLPSLPTIRNATSTPGRDLAARPAIGPSQRDAPVGAGVGVGLGVAAPAAGEAAVPAGAVGAGAGRDGVTLSRCAPSVRPPPMRRASARSLKPSVSAATTARSRMDVRFIGFSSTGPDNMAVSGCECKGECRIVSLRRARSRR